MTYKVSVMNKIHKEYAFYKNEQKKNVLQIADDIFAPEFQLLRTIIKNMAAFLLSMDFLQLVLVDNSGNWDGLPVCSSNVLFSVPKFTRYI